MCGCLLRRRKNLSRSFLDRYPYLLGLVVSGFEHQDIPIYLLARFFFVGPSLGFERFRVTGFGV